MDQINAFFESVDVFRKLGIDSTIIFQFLIFLGTFFILKVLFFNKLLFVLEQREGKTTKLESTANDKFAEAEKLANKYSEQVRETNVKAQEIFSEKKTLTIDKERARFKSVEADVNKELDAQRSEIEKEFQVKKEQLLKNADALADELSNRLTT
ncbi:MAG: F-type H+-transporting ATPase subunit b [Bacteriovoracaceae bacterium]|jgi:F-type H+-transporting ATPase subunit b